MSDDILVCAAGELTPGTINFYRNDNFEGQHEMIADVMSHPHNQLNRLPSGMNDAVSSMRWNLPPGVVVTFYQDAGGEKQQAAIWGNGQASDVDGVKGATLAISAMRSTASTSTPAGRFRSNSSRPGFDAGSRKCAAASSTKQVRLPRSST